ncbi:MAG: PTS sugar transporter subunit IIA [candidate division KSB1 bacterium]|nr:PTS sugar transporter subunit IIA [candidate division KSB1 bacterium]
MLKVELGKHFDRNLFLTDLQSDTKKQALGELLDLFVDTGYIKDRDVVLEMLNQRETLGSTGIGNAIAIPHGRTTAAADVIIAFGKSSKGIEFDAIDKKPVHLFFMVIAPPNDKGNIYLPILGSLVTVLNKQENREQLMSIETFDELMSIINGE